MYCSSGWEAVGQQVPVVGLRGRRRVPWVVRETDRCSDGVYRHLLRDLSSVQYSGTSI